MSIRDWFSKKFGAVDQPRENIELVRFAGHPELDHVFIQLSQRDIELGLEGWNWLDISALRPIAVASFGDVFFLSQDGSVIHLDWIEGRLATIAQSLREFEENLDSEEVRDSLLLAGFTLGARARGLLLEAGECYDFKIPPILGGPMDGESVEKLSFVVKLHMAGQIHEQVRDLPPGTKISTFRLED